MDRILELATGPKTVYVAEPSEPSTRAVVVLHELLGLNDDIRRITDRFAAEGYLAVAPDLFEDLGSKPFCMARAMTAIQRGGGPVLPIVEALADHLRADGATAVGVAGFCMGGGFALLCAGQGVFDVAAPFYGGVPSKRRLPALCPTVASFGGRDLLFRQGAKRLRTHLEAAGIDHDVKLYPNAGHSFMSEHPPWMQPLGAVSPLRTGYEPDAATDAWRRMLAFFDRHLPEA
jgi:carboxymethylenebutenolidase